jgi:hypothetical protein
VADWLSKDGRSGLVLRQLVFFGLIAGFLTLMVAFPSYILVHFLGGKLGWTQGRMSRVARGFFWAAVVLFAFLYRMGFVLEGSNAEGMEWDSPDGRYNAQCWVGTTVGFFGGKRDYVEYQVVELATGKQVVHLDETRSDPAQDWRVRDGGEVRWTPDSTRVTFFFGEGHQREFKIR